MLSTIFCGEFDELFNKNPSLGSWAKHVNTNEDAYCFFGETQPPHLLLITKARLDCCADKLIEMKKKIPSLTVVLVYDKSETTENLKALKAVPVIDHLIPMWSSSTLALFNHLGSPEGRTQFVKNREELFCPVLFDEVIEKDLRSADQCAKCYDEVMEYTENLGCFAGFSEIMATASSELLTNAFYNGKRDPKTGLAITENRQEKVVLGAHEKITFRYGKKDGFFWLVVSDSFGSLDRATLLKALDRAATERTPRMDTAGGAGLGLLMLFEWASDLSFTLKPGKSTTVASRFKICRRQKEFDSEYSSIHIFSY